jgi:hypothetical protein
LVSESETSAYLGLILRAQGIGGLSALMGRTFMSAMRRWKKVSRTVAGRVGYRGGVNAIGFAIKLILNSSAVEVMMAGMMLSNDSGRWAENSVRDAKGSRLGSGMTRTWIKRRLRHW